MCSQACDHNIKPVRERELTVSLGTPVENAGEVVVAYRDAGSHIHLKRGYLGFIIGLPACQFYLFFSCFTKEASVEINSRFEFLKFHAKGRRMLFSVAEFSQLLIMS